MSLRQTKELAQSQIGIARNIASCIDDRMDAIARNANRMSELVLAHADLVEKLFFQNLARMRIAKLRHDCILRFTRASVIVHDFNIPRIVIGPPEANPPLVNDPDAHLANTIALKGLQSISGWISQILQCRRGIQLAQFK